MTTPDRLFSMKSITVLAMLLVGCLANSELNLCEENDPRCTCFLPNVLPGTLVRVDDKAGDSHCFCPCGQVAGGLCTNSDECAIGTSCGAPVHFETHTDKSKGICIDRCKHYRCPEFHVCRLNTTGSPVCHGSAYPCSNKVNVQVCAINHDQGTIKNFYNMCYFVNENFERERNGAEELERIDCVTGAVMHGH